jgi:hypothetical protein
MITLKLTQSIFEIQNLINEATAKELNKIVRRRKAITLGKLKNATAKWIAETDEISSITNPAPNELKALFGITGSKNAVQAIIESVAESVVVEILPFDKKLRGSVTFKFQPQNNLNLLALKEGHQITEKGTDLHWLDWLLTKGDSVIVIGYRYSPRENGRGGRGVMKKGGTFRVNPKYSGIIGNNFVSKAFIGREQQVVKIIEDTLL